MTEAAFSEDVATSEEALETYLVNAFGLERHQQLNVFSAKIPAIFKAPGFQNESGRPHKLSLQQFSPDSPISDPVSHHQVSKGNDHDVVNYD